MASWFAFFLQQSFKRGEKGAEWGLRPSRVAL
jgi:hypothetical protein